MTDQEKQVQRESKLIEDNLGVGNNPHNPSNIDINDGSYDLANVETIPEFCLLRDAKVVEYYLYLIEEAHHMRTSIKDKADMYGDPINTDDLTQMRIDLRSADFETRAVSKEMNRRGLKESFSF